MNQEINMDITGEFRQCVLKLANTYDPKFELSKNHKNQHDLFDEFTKNLCQDFSDQLYPLFLDVLYEKFDQQLH